MSLFVSVLKDYPSIAHLVQKLSDNNIQTIFAVTQEFQPVYQVSAATLIPPFFSFLVFYVGVLGISCVCENIHLGQHMLRVMVASSLIL